MSQAKESSGPVLKFKHIGVAVPRLDEAVCAHRSIFGYEVLSGPFDDPLQRVSVCFVGTGEAGLTIELIAPLAEDSPIKRTLASGGGAYHLCYEVENIEQTMTELLAKGCVAWGDLVPAVAFGGRRIGWLFTPWRQLLEIVER